MTPLKTRPAIESTPSAMNESLDTTSYHSDFGTPDFIWIERSQKAAGSVTSQLGIIHPDHRLAACVSQ
jgi:hypothetical protein